MATELKKALAGPQEAPATKPPEPSVTLQNRVPPVGGEPIAEGQLRRTHTEYLAQVCNRVDTRRDLALLVPVDLPRRLTPVRVALFFLKAVVQLPLRQPGIFPSRRQTGSEIRKHRVDLSLVRHLSTEFRDTPD